MQTGCCRLLLLPCPGVTAYRAAPPLQGARCWASRSRALAARAPLGGAAAAALKRPGPRPLLAAASAAPAETEAPVKPQPAKPVLYDMPV